MVLQCDAREILIDLDDFPDIQNLWSPSRLSQNFFLKFKVHYTTNDIPREINVSSLGS